MPDLTPQEEAQNIAALSAWVLYEESQFDALYRVLSEAGCSKREILCVMTSEVC
jgi:hypothetical protein